MTDSVDELAIAAEQEFYRRFARSADVVVLAPGRVNLMGEHLDYNDGFCLPMAIERYVVIAAGRAIANDRDEAIVFSTAIADSFSIPLGEVPRTGSVGWRRYVEGVFAGFMGRSVQIPPFEAVIHSNIPMGAGLASSAALEVCVATLLEEFTDDDLEPMEKVLLCQRAEHEFAGVPCGIMDQFSSVFGQPGELMLLDCQSEQFRRIPFDAEKVSVLITDSDVKHDLAEGEYAIRRVQCERALRKTNLPNWRDANFERLERDCGKMSETENRRARHIVSEISRTREMAEAIQERNWPRAGHLMYASHASLRADFEVSSAELDILVDFANEIGVAGGVFGSRMTGGGFGGCTVSLVETEKAEMVMHQLTSQYKAQTGNSAMAFLSPPARGAYVLRG